MVSISHGLNLQTRLLQLHRFAKSSGHSFTRSRSELQFTSSFNIADGLDAETLQALQGVNEISDAVADAVDAAGSPVGGRLDLSFLMKCYS